MQSTIVLFFWLGPPIISSVAPPLPTRTTMMRRTIFLINMTLCHTHLLRIAPFEFYCQNSRQSDLRKEHFAIGIGGKMVGHVMLSSSILISLIVLFFAWIRQQGYIPPKNMAGRASCHKPHHLPPFPLAECFFPPIPMEGCSFRRGVWRDVTCGTFSVFHQIRFGIKIRRGLFLLSAGGRVATCLGVLLVRSLDYQLGTPRGRYNEDNSKFPSVKTKI
jgi:hypothetical protein